MKTQILLTTIAAAALAVITLNASAGTALLSPRAAGNQIKTAPGVTSVQPAFTTPSVSPRAAGNQTAKVAGTNTELTPAVSCVNNMSGSPKTIQACAEHPGTMPGCNPVAIAR